MLVVIEIFCFSVLFFSGMLTNRLFWVVEVGVKGEELEVVEEEEEEEDDAEEKGGREGVGIKLGSV